jgi:hypothetical protein
MDPAHRPRETRVTPFDAPFEMDPPSPVDRAAPASPQRGQAKRARRRPAQMAPQSMAAPAEPVPMLDVEAALKEITTVSAATIHRTAAFAWASRAIASYRVCARKLDVQEGLSYLYLGEHYREAALAHAAMGEAWQPLFNEIDEAMAKDRALAFEGMRGRSPVATR